MKSMSNHDGKTYSNFMSRCREYEWPVKYDMLMRGNHKRRIYMQRDEMIHIWFLFLGFKISWFNVGTSPWKYSSRTCPLIWSNVTGDVPSLVFYRLDLKWGQFGSLISHSLQLNLKTSRCLVLTTLLKVWLHITDKLNFKFVLKTGHVYNVDIDINIHHHNILAYTKK